MPLFKKITISSFVALSLIVVSSHLAKADTNSDTRDASTTAAQQKAIDAVNKARAVESQYPQECEDQAETYTPAASQISADQYVPVHETGDLLSFGKETDTNSGQSERVLEMLCANIKSIRRVQLSQEYMDAVLNPDARVQSAAQIEKYKDNLYNKTVKSGYASTFSAGDNNGTPDSSIFPLNRDALLADNRQESYYKSLDDIATWDLPYIDTALEMMGETTAATAAKANMSTATKDLRTKLDYFNNGKLSAEDWVSALVSNFNPENTPEGTYNDAEAYIQHNLDQVDQETTDELSQGNGFLPNRFCAEETTITDQNGRKYCRTWLTITPGKTIADTVSAAANSKLDIYENADTAAGLASTYEPNTGELMNMQTDTGNYQYNPPTDNTTNDNPGNQNGPTSCSDTNTCPTISSFDFTNISSASATLEWSADANRCTQDDAWLYNGGYIGLLAQRSVSLPAIGSTTISLPLDFSFSVNKNRNNQVFDQYLDIVKSQSSDGLYSIYTYTPSDKASNKTDINFKDSFTFTFDGVSLSVNINNRAHTAPADLLNSLITEVKNKLRAGGFINSYTFSIDATAGTMTISPKITYSLRCSRDGGSISATTTLSNE